MAIRKRNREKDRLYLREQRRKFKESHGYGHTAYYDTKGLREAVLQRDDRKCVVCGMTEVEHKRIWGRSITIDHKDKNRRNNTMENLQTLCLRCHTHKDRHSMEMINIGNKLKAEIFARRVAGQTFVFIAKSLGISSATAIRSYHRNLPGRPAPLVEGKCSTCGGRCSGRSTRCRSCWKERKIGQH